ncbi:MAG: Mpo1-like protein [Pseudomonadota bacterium]
MTDRQPFRSFAEFYPYYLGEHADRTCRRLHFAGTTAVIGLVAAALAVGPRSLLWGVPLAGYGMAWIGHFFFEKNRPATFQHPFYSLWGDFVMYKDMLTGKIAF